MVAIQLSSTDFPVSERLSSHVVDKLAPCERYCSDLERLDVTIHRMPLGFRVDVGMHRRRGGQLSVHEEAGNVFAAVTRVRDRCRKRLRRLHRRRCQHERSQP